MRGVVAVAVVFVAALVGSTQAAATPSNALGSCGVTPIRSDERLPAWTAAARPPSQVPFVVSTRRSVVAILFGYPLRSGAPLGHTNKILWIMREPRNGQPLDLVARPLHRKSPSVRVALPADSSPGEIYPSIVNVPSPGCWHLTLIWNRNRDAIDLRYGS